MNNFSPNIVFMGERLKFDPPTYHKPSFPEYKPYQVNSTEMKFNKEEYPYANMRFQHLTKFYIPEHKYEHPYLDKINVKATIFKDEHYENPLGLKTEMLPESGPLESKLQMGLDDKTTVKQFATMNLKESDGNETTLSRHRINQEYDVPVLPFVEQYKQFVEERKKVTEHNVDVDVKTANLRKAGIAEDTVNHIEKTTKKSLEHHRRKITVEVIEPPKTPEPEAGFTTPQKRKNKHLQDKVGKKVDDIEENIDSLEYVALESLLSSNGKAGIPKLAREKATSLGIVIPTGVKTGWLRKYLETIS